MIQYKTFTFNPFQENTYLIFDNSQECIVLDPGCSDKSEQHELVEYISENNLKVTQLINTHAHIDHVLGNDFVLKTYQVPFGLHKADLEVLRAVKTYASNYGFPGYQEVLPTHFIDEGDTITFGYSSLEVLFVPGHAPGHIALVNREQKLCFSGDVLFRGSIGRTDFPNCSHKDLVESIKEKIFILPPDTRVLSGHGSETMVGWEKIHNPFVGENAIYLA